MEEARHAWSSLRSIGRSSLGENSSTVWYDLPAPVIVHCREFAEETEARTRTKTERMKGNDDDDGPAVLDGERIYENEADMAEEGPRNELREVNAAGSGSLEHEEPPGDGRRRSTLRLTALSSVDTDPSGMPIISFSFLRADEARSLARDSAAAEDAEAAEPRKDRLYDFPRTSTLREASEIPTATATATAREDDVEEIGPRRAGGESGAETETETETETEKETAGERPPLEGVCLGPDLESSEKRLARLRRRSGFADPRKRRLGRAWEKMRSWLREETGRINEVVAKHARLQAVGALEAETRVVPLAPIVPLNVGVARGCRGSYDLVEARIGDAGSVTRVEEFGPGSCTASADPSDEGSPGTRVAVPLAARPTGESHLRRKTASSDDIFAEESKRRIPATSVSMDELRPDAGVDARDAEAEVEVVAETEAEATTAAQAETESATEAEVAHERPETRERAPRAGPIKRRMLGSIRGLMASTHLMQYRENEEVGQGGFEDVRRYVKQGGDFCKELAAILHERAELEATYAKGLSKLSGKLTKACAKDQGGNGSGGVNEAWRCVGEEMEAAAEAHRIWGIALGEQLAKPLRVGVAEAQGRSRKSIENSVDKAGKSLQEWRNIAIKSKKQSFACARENERLQDLARLQSISQSQQQSNNKSSSHHATEKEASKLETRRRKAEDSSRRADTEFYTVSVRAERARLEYESTVRKGAKQMELLEEERLSALKDLANVYMAHLQALAPRLQQSADRLAVPVRGCTVSQDIEILKNLIRRIDSNDACNAEQLLPDFYAEHVTLAMNRERRKQALVRVLHLIRQDLERERRGREGLETLHRAFVKTPAFAADESTQNVTDKLHHMRSMLLYLEAARYKVGGTLAEVEGSKRGKHPLAEHILVSRDKQGLQQSVLKIPSWAKNESFEIRNDEDEIEAHLTKDPETESRHWADRTAGDGNSENPPDEDDFSDFDEFSSHSEDNNNQEVDAAEATSKTDDGAEQCRAIYQYSANLNDELSLTPGDLITVHRKQPDGWWIGECRGRTGIFPATYVQVIH